MATKIWRGGAAAIGQITRVTFSAYTSGQTYTVTINGKSVSYVAAASTIGDVAAGLVAAWQASVEPEFTEVTPSSSSGLLLTATTLGLPFTVTASATGGITETIAVVTACTGPNYFTNAQNWVGGVAPVATDDLEFSNSAVDLLYDLENVAADYGDVTIDSTFTGAVGLPFTNSRGYSEYRPRFLKLGGGTNAFAITIGLGTGRQPTRILIDANAADVAVQVYGSGSSQNSELPIVIKNPGSLSELDQLGGQVMADADSAGTFAAIRVTPGSNSQTKLVTGDTVACGAVLAAGGEVEIRGGATSLVASNRAVVRFVLAATCPTVTVSGGAQVWWGSTAGITTKLYVQGQGTIDFSLSGTSKAVAACDVYASGIVLDPLGVVTWTSGMELQGCKISDCTIDIGRGKVISTTSVIQGLEIFDSENADRNLTSFVTVLTHTPDALSLRYCTAVVFLGDGVKDLTGAGGNFEIEVSIGGNLWDGGAQVIALGTGTRAAIQVNDFLVPANDQVIIRVKSPNAGDTDVDVVAMLVSEG